MKALVENSFNFTDMGSLKSLAAKPSDETLKAAAQQLEGVFLQMVLKSMRKANESFQSDMFDSQSKDFFQDFHDNQLSLHVSKGQGMGLADVIYNQLKPYVGSQLKPNELKMAERTQVPAQINVPSTQGIIKSVKDSKEPDIFEDAKAFVEYLAPIAKKALKGVQLNPSYVLAQAALETGWGKHILKDGQGQSSHNVFNIKAFDWQGEKLSKSTLEFEKGAFTKKMDAFRVYDNYEQSFKDYVQFLQSPRYEKAMQNAQDPLKFFKGLQEGGYATDPDYATKIMNVLNSPLLKALGDF